MPHAMRISYGLSKLLHVHPLLVTVYVPSYPVPPESVTVYVVAHAAQSVGHEPPPPVQQSQSDAIVPSAFLTMLPVLVLIDI